MTWTDDVLVLGSGALRCGFDVVMMPLDAIVIPSNLQDVRSRQLGVPFDAQAIDAEDRIILDDGPVMPSKLLEAPSSPRS